MRWSILAFDPVKEEVGPVVEAEGGYSRAKATPPHLNPPNLQQLIH